MSFLTAEWRKLAFANYEVPPEVLHSYVPAHTELDTWNGRCYASLVGFVFKKVKLLGLSVPFHTDFEEVNLRFYVRYRSEGQWKRGVVFVKEIVPKVAITLVANTVYREHYETLPMRYNWNIEADRQDITYEWKKRGQWQRFRVVAEGPGRAIDQGSEDEFITEHYWGYSPHSKTTSIEYEVTHPRWEVYAVKKTEIDVDFGLVYGERFSFLNTATPTSVMLAEGSPITIERRNKIKG